MKKLVRENLDFERGEDPKKTMRIGRKWKDDLVLLMLRKVKNAIERGLPEGYENWINIGLDLFDSPDQKEGYKHFVENWKEYEDIMKKEGLDVEEIPQIDETVFILT